MIRDKIQIRFSDTDMLGHINNTVIQQYYDIGKMSYFVEVLKTPFKWEREAFIIASITNNYFAEIRPQEPLELTTKVTKVGTKSITLMQQIINSATGELKGNSVSTMVAFNLIARESFVIHDSWRELITQHESCDE